jgi:hypothetical protein
MKLSYKDIEEAYCNRNFKFFKGPYNLNLYGIRNPSLQVNLWNDFMGIAWQDEFGNEHNLIHSATTKPGLNWLKQKKGNVNGTAILIDEEQYLGCWKLGKHSGKYRAFVQNGRPFKVWRDNDQDGEFDYNGKVWTNATGLNGHTSSLVKKIDLVGLYSAGCQVREFAKDHFTAINIAERSLDFYKNSFSYALFNQKTFN